jgi:hypothetical protein
VILLSTQETAHPDSGVRRRVGIYFFGRSRFRLQLPASGGAVAPDFSLPNLAGGAKFGDRGLQIIGVSMDDGPDPVRDFYQRFKMNYPVVIGNAKIGELYGGVLGLPIAFLLGRDGRIYAKHTGATDSSVFEKEILNLVHNSLPSNQSGSPDLD